MPSDEIKTNDEIEMVLPADCQVMVGQGPERYEAIELVLPADAVGLTSEAPGLRGFSPLAEPDSGSRWQRRADGRIDARMRRYELEVLLTVTRAAQFTDPVEAPERPRLPGVR